MLFNIGAYILGKPLTFVKCICIHVGIYSRSQELSTLWWKTKTFFASYIYI